MRSQSRAINEIDCPEEAQETHGQKVCVRCSSVRQWSRCNGVPVVKLVIRAPHWPLLQSEAIQTAAPDAIRLREKCRSNSKHYVQSHRVMGEEDIGNAPYDGLQSLWFENEAVAKQALASPEMTRMDCQAQVTVPGGFGLTGIGRVHSLTIAGIYVQSLLWSSLAHGFPLSTETYVPGEGAECIAFILSSSGAFYPGADAHSLGTARYSSPWPLPQAE